MSEYGVAPPVESSENSQMMQCENTISGKALRGAHKTIRDTGIGHKACPNITLMVAIGAYSKRKLLVTYSNQHVTRGLSDQ